MKAYGVARSVLGSVPRSVLGSVLCLALAACGDGTTGRDPGNTGIPMGPQGAIEDVRIIATGRLLLDNFDHVKAYWVLLSPEMASMALNFGASDLDGTIGQEKIAHAALAKSPVGMAELGMVQMIREAGKTPVQRDALYRVIREYPRTETATAVAASA